MKEPNWLKAHPMRSAAIHPCRPHTWEAWTKMSLLEVEKINSYYGDSHILFDVSMRLTRVSAFLPEMIQAIQSRRATGVMSVHVAFAAGLAASALRRYAGILGSGSFTTGATSSATASPASADRKSTRLNSSH